MRSLGYRTQNDLAQAIGVSRSAVSLWLEGKVGVPRPVAMLLRMLVDRAAPRLLSLSALRAASAACACRCARLLPLGRRDGPVVIEILTRRTRRQRLRLELLPASATARVAETPALDHRAESARRRCAAVRVAARTPGTAPRLLGFGRGHDAVVVGVEHAGTSCRRAAAPAARVMVLLPAAALPRAGPALAVETIVAPSASVDKQSSSC